MLRALLNDAGVHDARLWLPTADNGVLMVLGAELAASWGGSVAAAKDLLANEVTLTRVICSRNFRDQAPQPMP